MYSSEIVIYKITLLLVNMIVSTECQQSKHNAVGPYMLYIMHHLN